MLWVTLLIVAVLSLPFISRRVWLALLPWFKVVWACRVSVVSVVFGLLLLAYVPQARDLFADSEASTWWWVGFFLAMFFGWAFAVHYSARQVLTFDDWAVSRDIPEPQRTERRAQVRQNYRWPIAYVPRILGLLCFVALYIGIAEQRANFAHAGDRFELAQTVSDRMDQLLEATVLFGLAFAAFVVLRGAFVEGKPQITWEDVKRSLGAAPREISRTDPFWFRYWFSPSALRERWATRRHVVLEEAGTLIYFGVLLALLVGALFNPLLLSSTVARSMVLVAMLGAWVVPLSFVTIWSHYLRAPLLFLLFTVLSLTTITSAGFHDLRLIEAADRKLPSVERQVTINEAIAQWRLANCEGNDLERCPAPIIVAGQGGASRAAYFLGSVVGRTLDETRGKPETYEDAAKRIFALTTVSGGSLGAIVIRATLEDALRQGDPRGPAFAPCKRTDGLWFRAKAVPKPEKWEDCLQTILAGDFLSPTFVGIAFRDHVSVDNPFTGLPLWSDRATLLERSWEERFSAIVDSGPPQGADRNAGLARPLGYLKRNVWPLDGGKGWLPLLFLNATSVSTGHRIIASDVKPYLCDKSGRKNALYPQAYDIFELFSWEAKNAPPEEIGDFCVPKTADNRAGVVKDWSSVANEWSARAPDLRLSTAGAMSARFPVVSPAGRIAVKRDGETVVIDRVIDGGYFENDGLATALDVAKVLKDEGLRPVVVRVTNDPIPLVEAPPSAGATVASADTAVPITGAGTRNGAAPRTGVRVPRPGSDLKFPMPDDVGIFEPVFSPMIGLYNTRQGHGSEAADAANREVDDENLRSRAEAAKLEASAFIQVQTRDFLGTDSCATGDKPGKIRDVSMSWWLSQPVQAYLDAQVCDKANQDLFTALLKHLKRDARADLRAELPAAR